MEKASAEATRIRSLSDLKEATTAEGPCLTITLPLQHADNTVRQDHLRLKSAAQGAKAALAARGMEPAQIREFLAPVEHFDWESVADDYGTLVVLRAPDMIRHFQLRQELAETCVVDDRFRVLAFLRGLQEDSQYFFVLALSQNRVRLLRCTNHSSEEVALPDDTPTSLEEWLTTRPPNSSPNHKNLSGGNFTSSHDRDKLDQHVANFFHRINEGVVETLRNETAPLVIAAVEHEATMYRDINSYGHLTPHPVHGSPDGLIGGELHRRALAIVQEAFAEPMQKALQNYERLGGSDRVASKVAEVVKAAKEGRVSHLFVAEGAEGHLNEAALETLAHGGEIWVADPATIPGGGEVAALLRY